MKKHTVRRFRKKLCAMLSILLALCVLAVLCDRKMYPIVKDFSAAKARACANAVINESVAQMLAERQISYADLITLTEDENGQIRSAQVNSVLINRLKTDAVERIRKNIGDGGETQVEIPLGNLTGSAYLSGRGPCVRVKLKLSSNVSAKVLSEFYSTGINQSLHIIKMQISASVFILLPSGRSTVDYATDYLLGQTVIVGEVPDAFTTVLDGDSELAGIVNDYGAVIVD